MLANGTFFFSLSLDTSPSTRTSCSTLSLGSPEGDSFSREDCTPWGWVDRRVARPSPRQKRSPVERLCGGVRRRCIDPSGGVHFGGPRPGSLIRRRCAF